MSNLLGTTWVFKNEITLTGASGASICRRSDNSELFVSNGVARKAIERFDYGIRYTNVNGGNTVVYVPDSGGWDNEALKTITFTSEPNVFYQNESTFISWLEANAVKQVELLDMDGAKLLYNDLRTKIRNSSVEPIFTNSITIGNTTLTEAQLQHLLEIASVVTVNNQS